MPERPDIIPPSGRGPAPPQRPVLAVVLVLLFALMAATAAVSQERSGRQVVISAADIDSYLLSKGSPMAGQGAAFIASGGAWQVDPRLLVAIAGAESSFGTITCGSFNAWGWGCPNRSFQFESWADGIETVTRGLRENYLSEGRTSVALIHAKYAPIGADNDPTGLNNAWTANVSRFLVELGGDPDNIDLLGVAGTRLIGLPVDPFSDAGAYAASSGEQPTGGVEVQRAGPPARVRIDLENVGAATWTGQDVRLRRIDANAAIRSAPLAGLATDEVEPGDPAGFTVELVAAAGAAGTHLTRWRLEGPAGTFGEPVEVEVSVVEERLRWANLELELPSALRVGEPARIVVRVENAGARTWGRDGDGQAALGVLRQAGPELATEAWIEPRIPALLLERSVAPGERGSFAFEVEASERGTARLELQPILVDRWIGPRPMILEVEVR